MKTSFVLAQMRGQLARGAPMALQLNGEARAGEVQWVSVRQAASAAANGSGVAPP